MHAEAAMEGLQRTLCTMQGVEYLIHDDDELSTQSMLNAFGLVYSNALCVGL